MLKKYLYILCFLFLFGSESTWSQSLENKGDEEIFISEGLLYPAGLTLVNDWLFVKDVLLSTGDFGIKVFDINSGKKVYEFISPGRGPGEYLSFEIRKGPGDKFLEISDNRNYRNDIYDVPCLMKKLPVSETHSCIVKSASNLTNREAVILNDSLVLNIGAKPKGVIFINKGAQIIYELDSIPDALLKKYNNPIVAAMTMSGYLAANTERSRVAYFAEHYDKYSIYDISTLSNIHEITSHKNTYLPEFDVTNVGGNYYVDPSSESRFAFRAPAPSTEYIFVPYSGKTETDIKVSETFEWRASTNRIKVFNWDGDEVKEIQLNHQVSVIDVDLKGQVLFGIHYNQNEEPHIIKHVLVK